MINESQQIEVFKKDTELIAKQTDELFSSIYPMYMLPGEDIPEALLEKGATGILNSMNFFKIKICEIDNMSNQFEYLNNQMQRLLTALYSLQLTICYGVISYIGETSLIIGLERNKDLQMTGQILEGLLSGTRLQKFDSPFKKGQLRRYGMINAVPTISSSGKLLEFDISPIMKALNNQNYTLLVLAKPVLETRIGEKFDSALQIRDNCTMVSKRNVSYQNGLSKAIQDGSGNSATRNKSEFMNTKTSTKGLSFIINISKTKSESIVKGRKGSKNADIDKNNHSFSWSDMESYNHSVTDTINKSGTMAFEVQNGFALELISIAEQAIDRLKIGKNTGMWEMAVTYSTDSDIARNLIQGCLFAEMAQADSDTLPVIIRRKDEISKNFEDTNVLLPLGFLQNGYFGNPLTSLVTSYELSRICTFPTNNVPGFEIRTAWHFPLSVDEKKRGEVDIGYVCDGIRPLENTPFAFSNEDLNKHLFVCGAPGYGKTSTIKRILTQCDKPFLVVEAAKAEYRNIRLKDGEKLNVFTFGRPEINCPQMNPFYIQAGVSLQTHIDFLKELFNASFSFYGSMPHIFETCLYRIYEKRGWSLTLGYHPRLVNTKSVINFFDYNIIKQHYNQDSHKYLFPNMEDLRDEIEDYISNELQYDGEVSGNIKTAMRTRLDSLCVGAKGFMYNTHSYWNIEKLLSQNTVLEMEGITDSGDQAFAVGLLLIFIIEFRRIEKEISPDNSKLKHLLVVEEAHRLLKNMETERSSEGLGNPKGKALELFTSILAEMRSYGQGVIIAEQIPSKIIPDVIKNTSNKIVHRIVSHDDQQAMGTSIGLLGDKAVYLGNQETGIALCHKEGMALPVVVSISGVSDNCVRDSDLQLMDLEVRREAINQNDLNKLHKFNEITSMRLLNTILTASLHDIVLAIEFAKELIFRQLRRFNYNLLPNTDVAHSAAICVSDNIIRLLSYGMYSKYNLPADYLCITIKEVLDKPCEKDVDKLLDELGKFYFTKKLPSIATNIVALLAYESQENEITSEQLQKRILDYFIFKDSLLIESVMDSISSLGGEEHG